MSKKNIFAFLTIGIAIVLIILTYKSGHLSGTASSSLIDDPGYMALSIQENGNEKALDQAAIRASREAIGLDDGTLEMVKSAENGNFCFDSLLPEEQTLYAEVLTVVNKHAENVIVSTTDADQLQKVVQCVFNDHPEIYWIDGYSFTKHTKNNQVVYLSFSGKYEYSLQECKDFQRRIDSYISRCFGGISKSASDYDKVKYVYEYLIDNTDYVEGAPNDQNILSVFLNGQSVCQGYSKATQYLLIRLGVPCTLVTGTVTGGQGHAWNLVNIDGAYYYLDTTWGDSSYNLNDQRIDLMINYEYLNVTTDELCKTHVIDSIVTMPRCVATADNYYVKEKLLFDKYDSKKLGRAFSKAYQSGEKALTIKCSDYQVYSEMLTKLIDGQEIFEYLKGESVTYSLSESDLTINFWL